MKYPVCGVIPVAHTPFDENDAIDWTSLDRQVTWAFEQGAHGVCTGMVSELLRLTYQERVELTQHLADVTRERGAFVASVGAESTKQAVAYTRVAEEAGADGVMAVPPLAAAVSNTTALIDYFRAIANAIEAPVIVQDASGYVGESIPMVVYRELLDRLGPEKILFKPEAAPVGQVISRLRDISAGAARVFEGSGGNLLIDSFRRGIAGTIPGMEFLPAVVALWNALQANDEESAYRIYFPLCALVTLQLQGGLDGFLAIEKYVLHRRQLFATDNRRGPYSYELDEETTAEVDRLYQKLDEAVVNANAS